MSEEKKTTDVVLVNVSKNDTNVNVSVANSVLSWIADLFKTKEVK